MQTPGRKVRVLLAAMPDTVSSLAAVMRIPNLGICSLAGSLGGCEVRALDLSFVRGRITPLLEGMLREFQPDLVGISAMSFQYESARRVARICRDACPGAFLVLGGYHATLLFKELAAGSDGADFDALVRGEGEAALAALARGIAAGGGGMGEIPGLSLRRGEAWVHNPPAALRDLDDLPLPDRGCRVLDRSRFMKMPFDCVETSRGCTMGCTFCSIRKMYGRSVRFFPLDRVLEDLRHPESARHARGVLRRRQHHPRRAAAEGAVPADRPPKASTPCTT